MNNETIQDLKTHAIAEFPRESCGVVCVVKGRERYLSCHNKASTPQEHFVLDPSDFADAEDMGEIIAIVHSHPNVSSRASQADRVSCEASGLPWHIVSVSVPVDAAAPEAGEVNTITPEGYEAPLVGRQFFHGVLDCYSLVRDWYKREKGVELPNYARHDDWWNDGKSNFYMSLFGEAGFEPIAGDMQRGDIILMQIRSGNDTPNHAGVYLGDGVMLHHLYGRLSSRDVYGGYYAEVTRLIIRLKDLQHV